MAIVMEKESGRNKILNWRNPMTFAAQLGSDYLVAGSTHGMDVIHKETSKIVHVFETKRDKIKSLALLACQHPFLCLEAEEESPGPSSRFIILIQLES